MADTTTPDRPPAVVRIRGLSTLRQYQRRQWEECGDEREPYVFEGKEIVEGEEGKGY